jgi:hypothetical protein
VLVELFSFLYRKAKLLLKKKYYLESLLDKTDTQIDNLMQMVETLEYTQIEMKVVEGLKQGNDCLSEMHKVIYNYTIMTSKYLSHSSCLLLTNSNTVFRIN